MTAPGYGALEQLLGHVFRSGQLEIALTHKSFANEHAGDPEVAHNERLEFLGDAVIDLMVGHLLMDAYPEWSEGELSKARAVLVSEDGLAAVSRELGLGEWLRLGRGEEQTGGREKPSLLADAIEAIMGAVYLDGGYEAALEVGRRWFVPRIAEAARTTRARDAKTELQELVQAAYKTTPRYALVETEGPEHRKVFRVALCVKGRQIAAGSGRSKKEAEQNAAGETLQRLEDGGSLESLWLDSPPVDFW